MPIRKDLKIETEIVDRRQPVTVIAFSGLAPKNHMFEWAKSFSKVRANYIGIKDPYDRWWQYATPQIVSLLNHHITQLHTHKLLTIGGSAGGFGAILFYHLLRADRCLAFVPQTCCGLQKRKLGDCRWPAYCVGTPLSDLRLVLNGNYNPKDIEIHYGSDPLDILHAERFPSTLTKHEDGGHGHGLPHYLKDKNLLEQILLGAVIRTAEMPPNKRRFIG